MTTIFISYRQNDSPGDCRQLCERLQASFGHDNVFFDIQNIRLGDNWWTVARERIRGCNVLLVPIGQNWLNITDKKGRRRLDDPRDPLRMEIGLALKESIRTIPVLVEGASMPDAEQLPDDIRDLADLAACELRHRSFLRDVDDLISELGGTAPGSPSKPDAGDEFLATLGKSFAAKLGERLAGGGAAPPPMAPVQPQQPAYAPPAALNVTGTWQSTNGATHAVRQQGNAVTIETRNQFGVVVGQAQGTLNGNQLHIIYNVTYQPPYVVRGEARCAVSPDGLYITGQSMDPAVGMQVVQLRRVG
jgi:TIR domain-containing protein